jgi:hypothetical protein
MWPLAQAAKSASSIDNLLNECTGDSVRYSPSLTNGRLMCRKFLYGMFCFTLMIMTDEVCALVAAGNHMDGRRSERKLR